MKLSDLYNEAKAPKEPKVQKISKETLDLINPNDRVVMNGKKFFILDKTIVKQEQTLKPKGLWYGFGDSWIRWVRNEMPEWEKPHLNTVTIDQTNVLKIDIGNIHSFQKTYRFHDNIDWRIDWDKVSKYYKGVEIPNYDSLRGLRYDSDFLWLYGWDVSSGCIWDTSAVITVDKLV